MKSTDQTHDMGNYDWYNNFIYYLQHLEASSHLTNNEKRSLKLHGIRYIIVNGSFCHKNFLPCLKVLPKDNLVNMETSSRLWLIFKRYKRLNDKAVKLTKTLQGGKGK